MRALPRVTTIDGAYRWLLILTVLFAVFLWAIIVTSYLGWLAPLVGSGGTPVSLTGSGA